MIRSTPILSGLILSGVLLCAATTTALADGMMRKAGEWEITMTNGPRGAMTRKICFKTDKSASDLGSQHGPMTKECSPPAVTTSGGSITVDATCTGPTEGKVTIHAVITPKGDDAFHTETHMHIDGMQGMPDMTMVSDAKRIGDCQPGDKQVE